MQEQLDDDVPVVVGMACRFAGSDGPVAYWDQLRGGRSALGRTGRWTDEQDRGHVGGFLEDFRDFDARYFRISPNEARSMDPQQRLLLQAVQHSIDDSYLTAEELRDLRCGVFVAGLPGDYRFVVAQRQELAFQTHSFLGNAPSTLSGRISYCYDFTGPSITMDSACSSSLTALHQALLNVRAGHCRSAIVGAVSVFSTPEVFRFAQRSRMSSERGACLPFTDAADGFVPAEGTASVVVMRYGDARARGLRVYGAITATGINHNGTTNGLMAPSAGSQADLITEVYARAGVDPSEIAYVETHGTGTPLGDPIEIEGLKSSFRRMGGAHGCYLGAVKPIIGHTLVCSGLASVIKVLLSFHHETIPPMVRTDEPTSYINVEPFCVNHDPLPWPEDKPLCAISAFGFTGSNGHLVLRKPPRNRTTGGTGPRRPRQVLPFCLAAESEESLSALAGRYRGLAGTLGEDQLWDLSQLLLRRPRYTLTQVILAKTNAELLAGLDSSADHPGKRPAPDLHGLGEDLRELVSLWLAGEVKTLRAGLAEPAALAGITLPGYAFEKRRYWIIDDASADTEPRQPEPEPAPDDGVAGQLCGDLCALLGFGDGPDRVQPGSRIAALGLDSLSAVQLLTPYQQRGSTIKAHDLFRFETVADLAAAIVGATRKPERTTGQGERRDSGASAPRGPGPLMRWLEYGDDGRATILLPPLNADERAWVQQIPALLRQNRKVCAAVYPGHREPEFDAARFSLPRLAGELAEFIGGLPGDGRADLVGWSFGGCISALTALRHPERVNTLTLVSCAPGYGQDVFERTLDLQHELEAHRGLLEVVFDAGGNLVDSFSAGAPMEVLRYYYTALTEFDIEERLPEISAPTLVVRGRDDCVVDARSAELMSRIPGATLVEFTGHGHYLPLTAAREFNEALRMFWAAVPAGSLT